MFLFLCCCLTLEKLFVVFVVFMFDHHVVKAKDIFLQLICKTSEVLFVQLLKT